MLLHCHAFGQIARSIDIAATQYGHVVGQELKRDDKDDGLKKIIDGGNLDDLISYSPGLLVTLFHDGEMLLSTDSDSQWVVTIGDNERGETPMSFGPFFSKLAAMEYREGLDDESEWAVTQLYRPDYN